VIDTPNAGSPALILDFIRFSVITVVVLFRLGVVGVCGTSVVAVIEFGLADVVLVKVPRLRSE